MLFKHNQMSRNNKRKWDGECEGETSEGETSEGAQRKEHKSRARGRDLEHRRHRSPPPQRPLIPFERVTSEGETSEGAQRKEHKSRARGRDLEHRRHRSPPPQRPLIPFERVRTRTSFDNIIKTFDYEYHGPPDILRLLTKLKPFLKKKLENKFKENGPHKFFFAIHSTFNGSSGDEFTHILRRYKKKNILPKFYCYYVTVEPANIYLQKILRKIGEALLVKYCVTLMNS